MGRPLLLVLVFLSLVAAGPAAAETVVTQDREGRSMTFDLQSPDADVEWYAEILRGALHGEEISAVTIRIVPWPDISQQCGAGAGACYTQRRTGPMIVLPAGQSDSLAATVLHEYGHHIDATVSVSGIREPNGTPRWWAARGMQELVDSGEVARDYRIGWDRSIGEVFAEDYAQAHVTAPYRIRWLAPPGAEILSAIRQDLGAEPAGPLPPTAQPQRQALVVSRAGALRPRQARVLPFGLLGPNRRVTFTAVVAPGGRARMQIICNGRVVATRNLRPGQRRATLDRRGLGPAECRATLRNTGIATKRYTVRLRLAVEATSSR